MLVKGILNVRTKEAATPLTKQWSSSLFCGHQFHVVLQGNESPIIYTFFIHTTTTNFRFCPRGTASQTRDYGAPVAITASREMAMVAHWNSKFSTHGLIGINNENKKGTIYTSKELWSMLLVLNSSTKEKKCVQKT